MSDKPYKVGRGRPPLHSRYKPGQSGNPGGRPKGARNLRTLIAEEFKREVTAKEGGRPVKRPAVAVLTRVMPDEAHYHFVEMPVPRRLRATPPKAFHDDRPELQDRTPDRLVRDLEPALDQPFIDVPVAEGEPDLEPDGMLDDRGRELMAGIGDRHRLILPWPRAAHHHSRDNADRRYAGRAKKPGRRHMARHSSIINKKFL